MLLASCHAWVSKPALAAAGTMSRNTGCSAANHSRASPASRRTSTTTPSAAGAGKMGARCGLSNVAAVLATWR